MSTGPEELKAVERLHDAVNSQKSPVCVWAFDLRTALSRLSSAEAERDALRGVVERIAESDFSSAYARNLALAALPEPPGGSETQGVVPVPAPVPHRWPRKGDRMRFLGKNGYDSELARARDTFKVGQVLTVTRCDVGDWSHSVWFEGDARGWNGVMFELLPPAPSTANPDGDGLVGSAEATPSADTPNPGLPTVSGSVSSSYSDTEQL